ncbi:hypothetical protein [Chryseobacterium sp. JUb7]|uniref:hypothetical protein n=1 Tax=Chryseobacterium sp. JUb7 TaxID=2940599 RepID=UPI00216967AC|nr:hypothetical protein [Chryseobacterium sp. JUb7]MCS3530755.1 hypothetical protein [Chryseobacterium sp. JUb7]
MEKIIILISFLIFSHYSAQNKVEKLGKITKEAMKLYVKDTLKRPFKYGDYIAISIFSDSTFNKIGLYIETLDKDFKLYRNTINYKWFTFQNKNIIVFCGFDSANKCQEYFESLNFKVDEENNTEISDKETYSGRLDENTNLWIIGINKDYKITDINGKMIEAEIANSREFKKFLSKFSLLKMFQFYEGGELIDIKK